MASDHATIVSRFAAEVATACATAGLGILVMVGAAEFGIGWGDAGPEAGAFPFYVGVLIAAGSAVNLVRAVSSYRGSPAPFLTSLQLRRVAAFFLPMAAFAAVAFVLGLYVAAALYLCAVMRLQGGYRLPVAALVGVGTSLFFYLVLEVWFRVPLLKGPLEAWLGLH
jgi:hypothetical protein